MKYFLTLFLFLLFSPIKSQIRGNLNTYMLNQSSFNPGYMDISTRYGVTGNFRRQWMSLPEGPLLFSTNGHYHITKNHGIGGLISNETFNSISTFDLSANYAYQIWVNKTTAISFGLKAGFNQRTANTEIVAFDSDDPMATQTKSSGINVGTGFSIQSQNFDFGLSLPNIYNNTIGTKSQFYITQYNELFSHVGYKIRFSDDFIFYPTILARVVSGAPINVSFDGHFLFGQFFWVGGGFRTDKGAVGSVGVFFEKGLRITYTYENSFFSTFPRLDVTHEISLNYARTIADAPFTKRKYTNRKGGKFRRKLFGRR